MNLRAALKMLRCSIRLVSILIGRFRADGRAAGPLGLAMSELETLAGAIDALAVEISDRLRDPVAESCVVLECRPAVATSIGAA
jgi:hypothetical protein